MNARHLVRAWPCLAPLSLLLLLLGCGDKHPTSPAPQAKYEVAFALWLFDPAEISVVAQVRRLDPSTAPANSCVVHVNGDTLALNPESDAEVATYQLGLPGFSPGVSYSFIATVGARSAQSTLVAPPSLGALQILHPADSTEFTPGVALPIVWQYAGPSYGEADVRLVAGCADTTFVHGVLLDGDARTDTIPSAVTGQLESCAQGTYVEVIARTSGVVGGNLASPDSRWYIVLANDINQLRHPAVGLMVAIPRGEPAVAGSDRNGYDYRCSGQLRNLTRP